MKQTTGVKTHLIYGIHVGEGLGLIVIMVMINHQVNKENFKKNVDF